MRKRAVREIHWKLSRQYQGIWSIDRSWASSAHAGIWVLGGEVIDEGMESDDLNRRRHWTEEEENRVRSGSGKTKD